MGHVPHHNRHKRRAKRYKRKLEEALEHLRSLADAAGAFWRENGEGQELDFEVELVRANDFLERIDRNAK